jgi:hypothetical protein
MVLVRSSANIELSNTVDEVCAGLDSLVLAVADAMEKVYGVPFEGNATTVNNETVDRACTKLNVQARRHLAAIGQLQLNLQASVDTLSKLSIETNLAASLGVGRIEELILTSMPVSSLLKVVGAGIEVRVIPIPPIADVLYAAVSGMTFVGICLVIIASIAAGVLVCRRRQSRRLRSKASVPKPMIAYALIPCKVSRM